MTDILRPVLELSVIIPGILLAYLPVKSYLRQTPLKLTAWLLPLLLGICILGGAVCCALQIPTRWFLFPLLPVIMLIYHKTLKISVWKSVSIFLAVFAVFTCVKSLSRAVNALMTADLHITENELWLHTGAGIFYNVICLMFVLAMPAHAASKADELLQLVNAERAQAGVAPLSMGSSALNAAAQARAEELTVNYSYNRPNGSREFTILPEYGVDDVSVGENYWAAAEDASDVVAAWNRYDFFKERMLDKDATSVGVGYYEGGEYGNYWVMIFTYARGTSENGFAQEVLALVNAERAKENLAPLAMGDAKLQAAADERAKEVAKVASHTRPDGTNCFTVLKEYGVSDTATGENAAWGETTPEKVVADWMASEGHRVNIMDPAAKYMCLGYNYDANSQWGHNWIQIFAK